MGEMVIGERPPSPARLAHTSEKHPRGTLTELNVLRRHRELCDVVLNVGSRKIFAHRVILSACSPYFRAMFTGELAESRQTEVTIRDIDEVAMELLIDFCYTSHIVVEEGNVQTLLPADTHSCRELLRIADKFTQHNFQEVMESEEFLLLPVGQLVDIISSDELNVRSEEQVFSAVMSWVKYNVSERRQHLAQVLQHVRLPLLSPKFLVGTVGSDLLVRSDEACRDLVDEAKNYLLLPQERPLMQGPRTRPRKPTRRGEVLFAVGGWCSGDAIASVERFDPQSADWKMVAPMSKRRCGVGVAVLNDLLYAVGGHDGQSYLNSIERYDPQTNQWSCDVAPTTSCRTSVGVAVLDGFLYAVGGQDGVQCLNHVERYDPKENKWGKVAPMTTRRLGVAVAVLGGFLYAIGGSDGQCPLNTVNGQLYAVGGFDGTAYLKTIEVYDTDQNQWRLCGAMNYRRLGGGVGVMRAPQTENYFW
ncbi:Kelch-like protein diablo [Blattella germanica]|nr:Kelch-like protein diablo [Blattella germanica]